MQPERKDKKETHGFCSLVLRVCTKYINFADYSPHPYREATETIIKKRKRYYGKERRPQGAGEAPAGKG
jgi:hypothetical protein